MFRKVTLKPFTNASNVSPTSRSTDGIRCQSNKAQPTGQTSYLPASFHTDSFLQRFDDLFPMKTPILDENLPRVTPSDYHSRQINPRHIAFVRVRVERGPFALWIELHPHALHKRKIRVISRQREYLFCGNPLCLRVILHYHFVFGDFLNTRVQQSLNLPRLDAILDVRPHPVFDRRT